MNRRQTIIYFLPQIRPLNLEPRCPVSYFFPLRLTVKSYFVDAHILVRWFPRETPNRDPPRFPIVVDSELVRATKEFRRFNVSIDLTDRGFRTGPTGKMQISLVSFECPLAHGVTPDRREFRTVVPGPSAL